MRPLQISPETAIKLAESLRVPIEQLMHMPQHILLQKLGELAKSQAASGATTSAKGQAETVGSDAAEERAEASSAKGQTEKGTDSANGKVAETSSAKSQAEASSAKSQAETLGTAGFDNES